MADGALSLGGVLVRQLQGWCGRRKRGIASVSTSASVTGSATVNHGMSAAPAQIQATAQNSTNGLTTVTVANIGATTFDIGIRFGDGVARTTTINVAWEAVA